MSCDFLSLFKPSFCSHCLLCRVLPLLDLLTCFFLSDLNPFSVGICPYHFLPLGSVVPLSFPSGLLYPDSSSSLSAADTTNNLNNHLSTITTWLRQAKMTMFFFPSPPCDITVHCSTERKKTKEMANGLLNLIKRSISWTDCAASPSFLFQTCVLFFPYPMSRSSLLEICTHTQTHIKHFPGSKPLDAELGTWLTGVAKRKGNACHHLGDSITALCTPLQISLYTNICRVLSWHPVCLPGFLPSQ